MAKKRLSSQKCPLPTKSDCNWFVQIIFALGKLAASIEKVIVKITGPIHKRNFDIKPKFTFHKSQFIIPFFSVANSKLCRFNIKLYVAKKKKNLSTKC